MKAHGMKSKAYPANSNQDLGIVAHAIKPNPATLFFAQASSCSNCLLINI